uniref:Bidirectional sugar transporter SWEET n=1 Tax=Leersia perrieri TaxID=77586 RepID=A0A0D9VF48_9ORYZ
MPSLTAYPIHCSSLSAATRYCYYYSATRRTCACTFRRIPNGLGVMFAIAQLILYAIYYKSTQQIMEARKRKADQAVAMTEVVVDSSAAAKNGGHY